MNPDEARGINPFHLGELLYEIPHWSVGDAARFAALTHQTREAPQQVAAYKNALKNEREQEGYYEKLSSTIRRFDSILNDTADTPPFLVAALQECGHASIPSHECCRLLCDLIPRVAPIHRREILSYVGQGEFPNHDTMSAGQRRDLLRRLAPYHPHTVLKLTDTIPDERMSSSILTAVIPYVGPIERRNILSQADQMNEQVSSAHVYVALVPYYPEEIFLRSTPHQMPEQYVRTFVDRALAPYYPHEIFNRCKNDESPSHLTLKALAPYIPEDILKYSTNITNDLSRAAVLAELPPYVSRAGIRKILSLCTPVKMPRESDQALVLSAVGPYVSRTGVKEILERSAPEQISNESFRAEATQGLAPYSYKAVAARSTPDHMPEDTTRSMVLAAYAPTASPSEVREILAGSTPERMPDEPSRVRVYIKLAPHIYTHAEIRERAERMTFEARRKVCDALDAAMQNQSNRQRRGNPPSRDR